jgi:hypothetical protein
MRCASQRCGRAGAGSPGHHRQVVTHTQGQLVPFPQRELADDVPVNPVDFNEVIEPFAAVHCVPLLFVHANNNTRECNLMQQIFSHMLVTPLFSMRRDGREAEGGGLLNGSRSKKAY